MNLTNKSKQLAYLLRHDRKYEFDTNGWRKVSDLICNHGFTLEVLQDIVNTNNKQRYEFSSDMQYIRARQGHSIHVDVELDECVPPSVLYHGTAEHFVDDILKNTGTPCRLPTLIAVSIVDDRCTCILLCGFNPSFKIDSQRMFNDGAKFYLSRNGVWLTDYVAAEYLSFLIGKVYG